MMGKKKFAAVEFVPSKSIESIKTDIESIKTDIAQARSKSMDDEKQQLDQTIVSARDRVGDRIDELDRRLREQLDFKASPRNTRRNWSPAAPSSGCWSASDFRRLSSASSRSACRSRSIAMQVKKMRDESELESSGSGWRTEV